MKTIIGLIIFLTLTTCSPTNYTRAVITKDNGKVVHRKMKKTKCTRLRLKAQKRLQKSVRPVNYGIK